MSTNSPVVPTTQNLMNCAGPSERKIFSIVVIMSGRVSTFREMGPEERRSDNPNNWANAQITRQPETGRNVIREVAFQQSWNITLEQGIGKFFGRHSVDHGSESSEQD